MLLYSLARNIKRRYRCNHVCACTHFMGEIQMLVYVSTVTVKNVNKGLQPAACSYTLQHPMAPYCYLLHSTDLYSHLLQPTELY